MAGSAFWKLISAFYMAAKAVGSNKVKNIFPAVIVRRTRLLPTGAPDWQKGLADRKRAHVGVGVVHTFAPSNLILQ
jgi:hypothetical protein